MEENKKLNESQTDSDTNELEEKKSIIPFVVIGGGKGGDYPWLLDRPVGSNFLCKSNKSEIDLFEYWVVSKGERAVKVVLVKQDGESSHWVDPIEFSKVMFLYEIISD